MSRGVYERTAVHRELASAAASRPQSAAHVAARAESMRGKKRDRYVLSDAAIQERRDREIAEKDKPSVRCKHCQRSTRPRALATHEKRCATFSCAVKSCSSGLSTKREFCVFHAAVSRYLRKYREHLSVQEYVARAEAQNWSCASCGCFCRPAGVDRSMLDAPTLCVDHNHVTGEVRDLICQQCNLTYGHAGESVARLRAVLAYAEKWETS